MRFVGKPSKVVDIRGSRVYLERYRTDPIDQTVETEDSFCSRKTIRYVFSTEAEAFSVSDFTFENARQYMEAEAALKLSATQAFQQRIAQCDVSASAPPKGGMAP